MSSLLPPFRHRPAPARAEPGVLLEPSRGGFPALHRSALTLALLALALLAPPGAAQDPKPAGPKRAGHRELTLLEREYEKRSDALLEQWKKLVKARDIVSNRIEALRKRKIAILADSHGSEREEKLSAWNQDWDAAEKQKNALAVLWLKHQSLRVALIQEFRDRKAKLAAKADPQQRPSAPAASSSGSR